MTDAERLDYLEAIMRARMGFTEVYLAGLRHSPDSEATAFQVELPDKVTLNAPTLREAIDETAKKYPRVRM